MLINGTLSAVNGCLLSYARLSNVVYLRNDAGTLWLGPVTLGAGTLQNSQCIVNAAGSSASGSTNTLTVNVSLTFKPAFTGPKTNFSVATDSATLSSGWQVKGTWTSP
jgi:hypothetical protein